MKVFFSSLGWGLTWGHGWVYQMLLGMMRDPGAIFIFPSPSPPPHLSRKMSLFPQIFLGHKSGWRCQWALWAGQAGACRGQRLNCDRSDGSTLGSHVWFWSQSYAGAHKQPSLPLGESHAQHGSNALAPFMGAFYLWVSLVLPEATGLGQSQALQGSQYPKRASYSGTPTKYFLDLPLPGGEFGNRGGA